MKNQIHTFLIQGEITPQDLTVLNGSVLKYLESDPAYVIIDLSQAQLSVSELELQKILREIKTFAQAKDLSLVISQSDVESMHAQQMVVEMALQKKLQFLENKIEIDYLFYLTNQIMKPSMQFLELIANNANKIFDDYIFKIRKKLKLHNIEITTRFGKGWHISHSDKIKLNTLSNNTLF